MKNGRPYLLNGNRISVVRLCVFVAVPVFLLGCSPDKPPNKSPSQNTNASSPKEKAPTDDPPKLSFETRLAQADALLEKNDPDGSWRLVKELMIEQPNSPAALFVASRTLAKKNDLQGAIQLLSRIDPKDPQAGPAAAGQAAEWLAQTGDLEAAEAKLLTLLKSYPNAVPALRLLIDIYSAQGRRWESAKYIERLIRIGNFSEQEMVKSLSLRESFDHEQYRQAAMNFSPSSPYAQFGALRLLINKNRWSEVVEPLEKIVQGHPQLLEPWIWYGESLLGLGREAEMTDWLKRRPDGFALHPEYWYLRGSQLVIHGKTQDAARCFVESIVLDRRHVASINALASPLIELGYVDSAQQVRDFADELTKIDKLVRSIALGKAGRSEYVEVAERYEAIGDGIGAFGWQAVLFAKEKKPFTDELKAKQKDIFANGNKLPAFLRGIPYQDWPLPTQNDYESIGSSNDASVPPGDSGIALIDVADQLGVNTKYDSGAQAGRGWYILESNGGGVSALDYDRDGWPDLYFSAAGDSITAASPRYSPKQLFRSIHSKAFEDVTPHAFIGDLGYGQATGAADIDQDGFPDLLVANIGAIEHYRNQGDGTFERMELPQALPPSYWNSCIQAGDLNGDTLPDIVQGVYVMGAEAFTQSCAKEFPTQVSCHPRTFRSGESRLLFSQANGNWKVADNELLNSLHGGYTLGCLIGNVDQLDGNDVYFANDVSPNYLLLNKPIPNNPHRLVEKAGSAGVSVDSVGRSQGSMGISCGDQDRNGLIDILVTNNIHEGSTLYLQTTPGAFIDGTRRSNVGLLTMDFLSFGSQFADLDNDGWLDLTILNGHIDDLSLVNLPWKMLPQVLKNDQGRFRWLKQPSPGSYFDEPNVGRGLTLWDYNRDGKLDMVATHLDRPSALLENRAPSNPNHFLQLELVGTQSEREPTGAIISIVCGDQKWTVPVCVGEGFFGTNERLVHVGLGRSDHIDSVRIEWPKGESEVFDNFQVDRRYLVVQGLGASLR